MQPEAAPGARLNVAVNQIEVVRPNLRNLSPVAGSSASTLVLFDGHRVTVDLTANALHFPDTQDERNDLSTVRRLRHRKRKA